MNNRKYPAGLFVTGFFLNFFLKYWWLLAIGVIFLIIQIFIKFFWIVGVFLLLADAVISLVDQIVFASEFRKDSDDPEFAAFQEALSKDGNWEDNVKELVAQRMQKENEQKEKADNSEENDA